MRAMHDRLSVAMLRPVAELLDRLGEDREAFLAGLGVDADTAPSTYVEGREVDQRLAAIAAARGDASFGLTLARESVVRPLGLFGHMVWMSGTVRDALARAVKFYAAITHRTTLSLEESKGVATLRQHGAPGVVRGAILTELAFASLALRARTGTGDRFMPRAVRFQHAGTPSPAYAELFRAPVAFGADLDAIEIASAMLDLPLATADPVVSAALESKVAELSASGRSPLVDRVRRVAHLGTPTAIARELGLSARTLRRHLEQEGHSLRGIVDELRRERAEHLLARGVAAKDVAFQLGFSEPSALSRALKRWKVTRVK